MSAHRICHKCGKVDFPYDSDGNDRHFYKDHACTTSEERLAYKKDRRLKKLGKLVRRLGLRVTRGKESLKQIDMILERVAQQGYFPQIIEAIKCKN